MPKKYTSHNGGIYFTSCYRCACGYKFNFANCRLVNKIKKLHKKKCEIGNKATTKFMFENIDYTDNGIFKTSKIFNN
tara:strand:+ start:46 stop:276 length:231 start_codon:yes stop_codon:yes gene_type:complete